MAMNIFFRPRTGECVCARIDNRSEQVQATAGEDNLGTVMSVVGTNDSRAASNKHNGTFFGGEKVT